MTKRKKAFADGSATPVLCHVYRQTDEIVIAPVKKTRSIRLGGVKINMPIHLVLMKSRMVEPALPLADSAYAVDESPVSWNAEPEDDEEAEPPRALELSALESPEDLEFLMDKIHGPNGSLFLSTLSN